MAIAKTVFVAADGTMFETEIEAQAHDSANTNKTRIDEFVDRHFPLPAPVAETDDAGNPVLNEDGTPKLKPRSNNARGPVRRALALWLAENA
jgi:hypothetical protein